MRRLTLTVQRSTPSVSFGKSTASPTLNSQTSCSPSAERIFSEKHSLPWRSSGQVMTSRFEHCRVEIARANLHHALGEYGPARRSARRALAAMARTQSTLRDERGTVLAIGVDPAIQARLSRFSTRKHR